MFYYPRFFKKENFDEYQRSLAPEKALLDQLKFLERDSNHNLAFDTVNFEQRFTLSLPGLAHLRRLSSLAREKNIALVCQCKREEKCHCDLLLLMAKSLFDADIKPLTIPYPTFRDRLHNQQFEIH